jgi:transcriptional regulator with XRE-family HTH domain/Zn-dependent peptidase ImmA (M78 family)
MSSIQGLRRKAHFAGTKIKSLRKRNHLTLEDLSVRCVQIDAEAGPSVSYLSMIENGKRVPSERLLKIIAEIFQKNLNWFYDESLDDDSIDPAPLESAVSGLPLEPAFLFSDSLLQLAIPELLAQTGTTGRQFAHLLIRAHQESNQNRFPDLERAAESVGKKRFPLRVDDVLDIASDVGLSIKWFDKAPIKDRRDTDFPLNTVVRSFFDAPNTVYLNSALRDSPERLKFDVANHVAHMVLHDGDGARAPQISGGRVAGRRDETESVNVDAKNILLAWRDFECSYFAAALLAPKTPFRQFLAKHAYAIDAGDKVELTKVLVMRRMSSVSPYPFWHYFDAYPPGNLRAVYRGNGIPLPWGNMSLISDPCQHWAVFRMLNTRSTKPSSQISVLRAGDDKRLYCCQSIRGKDAAGNPHVLCVGVDLAPALRAQNIEPQETIEAIEKSCNSNGGSGPIPDEAASQLESIGKILNIGWIAQGAKKDATIICPRSSGCPRDKHCLGKAMPRLKPQIDQIRESLLAEHN